nr:hypothetical protein [Tanacetum cinerariifolium]
MPTVVGRKRVQIDMDEVSQIPLRLRTSIRSLAKSMDVSKSTMHKRIKEGVLRPHTNAIKPSLTSENERARPSKRYYLVLGENEPLRTCKSKKFMTKVMFLAAVARPRFDASVNKEITRSWLIEKVLPDIRAKWPRGHTRSIYIQQDNAKPHINVNDSAFLEAASRDGFDIRLCFQPPNSPDLNVLDLGFFEQSNHFKNRSIMDAPPSPNHVFNFPEDEFKEDPQEEPEEDPEEDPEEELEVEAEDDVPPPATPPVGSLITPPPLSESSSDTEDVAPVVANKAIEMPPTGSTYEVGGPSSVSSFPPFYLHGREIARLDDNTELLLSNVKYLEQCEKKRKAEMEANSSEISKVKKCMNEIGRDLGDEMQFNNLVENRVTKLEDKDQEKAKEMEKMKKRLWTLETNYALVLSDRDE